MTTLRKAKPEDAPAIGEIHMKAIREVSSSHYAPDVINAWANPRPASFYLDSINNIEFYVAISDDRIVGFGSFNPISSEVEGLFVDPQFLGRGIGLEILSKLEQTARAQNIKDVYLKASLNAVPFYERAGYMRREEAMHRLLSGAEIPCVIMDKRL